MGVAPVPPELAKAPEPPVPPVPPEPPVPAVAPLPVPPVAPVPFPPEPVAGGSASGFSSSPHGSSGNGLRPQHAGEQSSANIQSVLVAAGIRSLCQWMHGLGQRGKPWLTRLIRLGVSFIAISRWLR